jgi:hypothetical protein
MEGSGGDASRPACPMLSCAIMVSDRAIALVHAAAGSGFKGRDPFTSTTRHGSQVAAVRSTCSGTRPLGSSRAISVARLIACVPALPLKPPIN